MLKLELQPRVPYYQLSKKRTSPAIASTKQTPITNKVFISDPKLNAEAPDSYYDGTIFRCIMCDLYPENLCRHDSHKSRCCVQCESKIVHGIFERPNCSHIDSYRCQSQKTENLIAKVTKDRDGSSTSNAVTPYSTNSIKKPINDLVDTAAEPVTKSGKPDRKSLN